MSNVKMANVASECPTTMEELADCELPQNVVKQYGERLLKSINSFIEQSKLQKYIENRPKKKQKTAVAQESNKDTKPILIDVPEDSDEDEFADDQIDFSAVPMPTTSASEKQANSNTSSDKPNPYEQKKSASKPDAKPAARVGSKLKKTKRSSYFWTFLQHSCEGSK